MTNQIPPEAYESYLGDGVYSDSRIKDTSVMKRDDVTPRALCEQVYVMSSDYCAKFTASKSYEIASVMNIDGVDEILLIDDENGHHYFTLENKDFQECFTIIGDIETVRECR